MPKKRKTIDEELIIANELSLDEWLSLLGTPRWNNVLPKNCFPSDRHREEYLSRINEYDERSFKNLARSFLNKSGYYGVDENRFAWVIKTYGTEAIFNDDFQTEFDR